MSHNRLTMTPTLSQIQDGFPSLPRVSVTVEPERVPEPITGLVLAAGLGGAALKRAKDKSKKS